MTKSQKPQLSFWQIWNMCFGFMGIQFGFELQSGNMSRIFQTLGAQMDELAILWIAGPVTGLIVQPIIGYMSDRTWNRMGRRRPYFFWGAMLTTGALFLMPNSPHLWFAAGMLWILDASINISMEPFRAFVGDNLPEKQRARGYAMQSFFINVGAVMAAFAPWILANWLGVSNEAPEGVVPDSVKYSFYFGGAMLFVCIMWTVWRSSEYSPEELAAFGEEHEEAEHTSSDRTFATLATSALILGLAGAFAVYQFALDKQLYILTLGIASFGALLHIRDLMHRSGRKDSGYYHIITDLMEMPDTMKQLAVVQFFSWFAMFAMWIYSTPGVTAHLYGTTDTTSAAYNEGANFVSALGGFRAAFGVLAAIAISFIANRIGLRKAHAINLCLGGLGMMSYLVVPTPETLIASQIGIGFGWASILSLPYAMLSNAVPAEKMGTYMGIFNFFIVIPQMVAATILGLLVRELFGNEAIYALLIGGISLFIAAASVRLVKLPHDEEEEAA